MGLAVVGRIFISTFLTLVLVPVVYTLLARFTTAAKVSEGSVEEEKVEVAREEKAVAVV